MRQRKEKYHGKLLRMNGFKLKWRLKRSQNAKPVGTIEREQEKKKQNAEGPLSHFEIQNASQKTDRKPRAQCEPKRDMNREALQRQKPYSTPIPVTATGTYICHSSFQ